MSSKGLAIEAPNGYLFCGNVEDYMEYVLAKEHGGLTIYEPGNANTKRVAWLNSGQQE